jgi:hypothetical protein
MPNAFTNVTNHEHGGLRAHAGLETVRKDINLMLRFLEIAAAPKEIITKYKLINKNLSLMHEQKESENKLDEGEQNLLITIIY